MVFTNRDNRTKTQVGSITIVLFVSLVLSLLFPPAFVVSDNYYNKSLTENTSKDAYPEKETVEENEFFGGDNVLNNLNYLPNKVIAIVNCNPLFLVPKVSLEIPIPPPKVNTF
ncbi:MAG: hypothetical protein MUF75_02390 [Bacteroidia bacterium]|jgi:hypothetical protein|nr:hypothetical protein [Bacteroidia bacterium]